MGIRVQAPLCVLTRQGESRFWCPSLQSSPSSLSREVVSSAALCYWNQKDEGLVFHPSVKGEKVALQDGTALWRWTPLATPALPAPVPRSGSDPSPTSSCSFQLLSPQKSTRISSTACCLLLLWSGGGLVTSRLPRWPPLERADAWYSQQDFGYSPPWNWQERRHSAWKLIPVFLNG